MDQEVLANPLYLHLYNQWHDKMGIYFVCFLQHIQLETLTYDLDIRCSYVATVKFDSRNKVPYSALLQALSQILQQIMTEPQEEMRRFHHYLRTCLGARYSNIGILADFVPELGALLERPDSAKGGVPSKKAIATIQTDNMEAQNRFLNMYVEIFRSITFWRMITLVWYMGIVFMVWIRVTDASDVTLLVFG